MPATSDPESIRAAALAWLGRISHDGELNVTREQLANDFAVDGKRFTLIDRGRGIRKPEGWTTALSITTSVPKSGRLPPYEDVDGDDGLPRYKLRRDTGGQADNDGLREAMSRGLPLIWFYGVQASLFRALFPVYLLEEEPEESQFIVAVTPAQVGISRETRLEGSLRRYMFSETKRRLHQPAFSSQIMLAYEERCAVCSLNHRGLLDAAHIIGDSKTDGEPIVSNGLALCKIHHAAYDKNMLGIRPDYVVEINQTILAEVDGPMLLHGLQEHHGLPLMKIPKRRRDWPDPARLAMRYVEFGAA